MVKDIGVHVKHNEVARQGAITVAQIRGRCWKEPRPFQGQRRGRGGSPLLLMRGKPYGESLPSAATIESTRVGECPWAAWHLTRVRNIGRQVKAAEITR